MSADAACNVTSSVEEMAESRHSYHERHERLIFDSVPYNTIQEQTTEITDVQNCVDVIQPQYLPILTPPSSYHTKQSDDALEPVPRPSWLSEEELVESQKLAAREARRVRRANAVQETRQAQEAEEEARREHEFFWFQTLLFCISCTLLLEGMMSLGDVKLTCVLSWLMSFGQDGEQ